MKELILVLESTLNYLEHFMGFMAKQIGSADADLDVIIKVLKDAEELTKGSPYDIFTSKMFDFVTPDGRVIASTKDGRKEYKELVLPKRRSWMTQTSEKPWQGHFSKTDIGIISKEEIIPFGFGVTNSKGKFVGTISLGISVAKLKSKMQKTLQSNNYNFFLLDSDLDIVFYSGDESEIKGIDKENLKHCLNYLKNRNERF